MAKTNIAAAFAAIPPAAGLSLLAEVNDVQVKIGKFHGRFAWHRHADEDELFWVLKGSLVVQFRSHDVALGAGEMLVVPRGVEHRSVAAAEAQVVVIHPRTTVLPAGTPAEEQAVAVSATSPGGTNRDANRSKERTRRPRT